MAVRTASTTKTILVSTHCGSLLKLQNACFQPRPLHRLFQGGIHGLTLSAVTRIRLKVILEPLQGRYSERRLLEIVSPQTRLFSLCKNGGSARTAETPPPPRAPLPPSIVKSELRPRALRGRLPQTRRDAVTAPGRAFPGCNSVGCYFCHSQSGFILGRTKDYVC